MAKILVTGGAGFIGSHVCEALLKRGDKVICIDNLNNYYDPELKKQNLNILNKNKNFKFYNIDILDLKKLKRLFDENNIDKVIHLAARAGVRASIQQPQLYADVNIKGTINVLECIRECNMKNKNKITKLVFASSSSVYGGNKKVPFSENDPIDNPISPYAATKIAGELICKAYNNLYGIPIVCLRFFTVYGPRNRPDMAVYKFTKAISEGKEIAVFGDGESSRDYTFVADIADGILAALDKKLEFEIINLGNSKPIKLKELISAIEKNTEKKAKIKIVPMQEGDVEITYADITKAKKILNYSPKVNIEKGIKIYVDELSNQK